MRQTGIIRTIIELGLIAVVIAFAMRSSSRSIEWVFTVVHRVPTNEKVVALTFDDGPHPTFTPEILSALRKHHVKATFFMIGQRMEQYPDIVKDVIADGNAIGNHTFTHPKNIEADSRAQVVRELNGCESVIEKMTGKPTHIFRPPKGLVDGTVVTTAEEEGYQTILWTVSADHHDAPTPQLMAARVLKRIRPGAIILAHDGTFPSRTKDVAATPLIIEELQKRGYRFVTVPELLEIGARSRGKTTLK
jgi:peptidoglycan-N-acetylglucosamine deacetylase